MRHKKYSIVCIISIILIFITLPAFAQTIIYVDANVSGGANDGSSWTNAFQYLQDAFDEANANTLINYEIRVALGVYYTDEDKNGDHSNDDRTESFKTYFNNIKLYGGYPTGGGIRDSENNVTILSGDIDGNDENTDGNYIAEDSNDIIGNNSYHVMVVDGTGSNNITEATVIDGFVLTAGKADSEGNSCGGGMRCDGGLSGNECSPMVKNSTFSGNKADYGGAMLNFGGDDGICNPTITNVIFTGNRAIEWGGAISNSGATGNSSPTITNCNFNSNTARSGGAINNYGSWGNSSPTITNCTFTSNWADLGGSGNGGAIENRGRLGNCSPTLSYCSFLDNRASFGGAIMNFLCSSGPVFNNCTFRENHANSGGAMHNDGTGNICNPSLTNCLFSGNWSNGSGGAMYNNGSSGGNSSPTLINITFTGNIAHSNGGAMSNSAPNGISNPSLINCILWNDDAYGICDEVDNSSDANPNYTYCDIKGSGGSSDWDSSLGTDGGNNIDSDPEFVSSSDYHLQDTSPCIRAATADGCPIRDIEGTQRGNPPDIGAYENIADGDQSLPVELINFCAKYDEDCVIISWITASETNSLGFELYKKDYLHEEYILLSSYKWNKDLASSGNSTSNKKYCFTDNQVENGKSYFYKLTQVDISGKRTEFKPISVKLESNKKEGKLKSFILFQNYPNPFNSQTQISFQVPKYSYLSLKIFDLQGKEIVTLTETTYKSGNYRINWNGKDKFGNPVCSGIYVYELNTEELLETKKLILIR